MRKQYLNCIVLAIYNFAVNAKYNVNFLSFNVADEHLKVQKAKEFEKYSFLFGQDITFFFIIYSLTKDNVSLV